MVPKCSCKGNWKATASAKMPTWVMNGCLSLDRDGIKGFFSEHIRGLIWIYNFCGIKDRRAWDRIYDLIFLDPVTTRHISQFQPMWPYRRSRSSPFQEWWSAFRTYMGPMFDKTRNQMNNWRWDNPHAFRDLVDHSNPQTPSLGKVKHTGKRISWYGSNDPRATTDPPRCRLYKPDNFLAMRPLNWDEIIEEEDDDENKVDPGAPSGGWSGPGNGNDNDDGKGEEHMQGGDNGTGKVMGTKDGKGKGKATEDGKGKGEGKGKGNGKVLFNKLHGEMISLVPLLCSCRRKCQRQPWTLRAK